jgi:selenocysteine-specific elongation factor
MLAGVGPSPAVVLVVAADEGWMPQSEEHLQATVAMGAKHVLVVATKTDLAAPDSALTHARERVLAVGLPAPAEVAVSAATGDGLDVVRAAIADLVGRLPRPDADSPVRLWIDRAFSIRGAGTVVTGTLTGGRLCVGDDLVLLPAGRRVAIRGLQSLNTHRDHVAAVARVAVNLRGVDRAEVARGMTLTTDGAWALTDEVDLLTPTGKLPAHVMVHIGAAAVPAQLRRLGPGAVRVRLQHPLPLHLGDRLLLRDPASRRLAGADVADVRPRPLHRRGDGARVAAGLRIPTSADEEVARRQICTGGDLRAAGMAAAPERAVPVGPWWIDPQRWDELCDQLQRLVASAGALSAGVPVPELRRHLQLPDDHLVGALVARLPALVQADGRVRAASAPIVEVPGLDLLVDRLRAHPLAAPEARELADLGLGREELAHAVRAGLLTKLADGVYVAPTAVEDALSALAKLGDGFTVSEARELLGSTRRVVVPLLEHLDAQRRTRKMPDGTRLLVSRPA